MDTVVKSENQSETLLPYSERTTYKHRRKLVRRMLSLHPERVPIIIERDVSSRGAKLFTRVKFMVSRESTVGQFAKLLLSMATLPNTGALLIVVTDKCIPLASNRTLGEIYDIYSSLDGFVYLSYKEEDVYG